MAFLPGPADLKGGRKHGERYIGIKEPSYLTHCEQEVRLEYNSKGLRYANLYTPAPDLYDLCVRPLVP